MTAKAQPRQHREDHEVQKPWNSSRPRWPFRSRSQRSKLEKLTANKTLALSSHYGGYNWEISMRWRELPSNLCSCLPAPTVGALIVRKKDFWSEKSTEE
jgi:hypothetical protein